MLLRHPNHRRRPVGVFAFEDLVLFEHRKAPGGLVADVLERAPDPGGQADQIPFFEDELALRALFGVIAPHEAPLPFQRQE